MVFASFRLPIGEFVILEKGRESDVVLHKIVIYNISENFLKVIRWFIERNDEKRNKHDGLPGTKRPMF
jgi:hypothetical protein